MKSRICPVLPLGLATALAVFAVSQALAQSDASGFARDVEELVELAASARTMGEAEARFLELRRAAPADARVPYLYAMLLIDRNRFQDACEPLKHALRLDGTDLAAWKTGRRQRLRGDLSETQGNGAEHLRSPPGFAGKGS